VLAVVPAAGHMVTVERPAEVARLIERFLASPPASAPPARGGA
jgi:pimeloyl-ACP methyl ester carboxylesterase